MEKMREGKIVINYDKIKEIDPNLNFIDDDFSETLNNPTSLVKQASSDTEITQYLNNLKTKNDDDESTNELNNLDDSTIDGFVKDLNDILVKHKTVASILPEVSVIPTTTVIPVEPTITTPVQVPISIESSVLLGQTYTLWCHDINNKFWDIESYRKLVTFSDAPNFWKVINNFSKIGVKFNHFFLMKSNIDPTWEHEDNRNGGACSFKIELHKSADVFEYLCIKMVTGTLSSQSDDINGISLSPKNNWAIIKIWNADSKFDLSKTLTKEVIDKYSHLGIRYKPNVPEY